MTCHSKLVPTAENVERHIDPAHGGGWFRVRLRISDGKKDPLWKGLGEKGIELQELYCPHCRAHVPLVPRQIIAHLQPHAGANRVNLEPQTLCMTLGYSHPDQEDVEGLYMNGIND